MNVQEPTTLDPRHAADCRAPLDVLVVGAGQAGLAVGHHLAQRRLRFLLVDAAPELGHSWRTRWDSLRLFTPAEYDGLPGMAFPSEAGTYPDKDQVADYLQWSVATIYDRRLKKEDLPKAIELPGGLRWRRSDVDAWLDAQAT